MVILLDRGTSGVAAITKGAAMLWRCQNQKLAFVRNIGNLPYVNIVKAATRKSPGVLANGLNAVA